MSDIIYKSNGTPFEKIGHAKNALRMKGLLDTHEVVKAENGMGYIGVKKTERQIIDTDKMDGEPSEVISVKDLDSAQAIEPEESGASIIGEVKPKEFIKQAKGQNLRKVRVHWADGENKDVPISVCVNNAKNRIIFTPGEEVKLTESQIGVLRDAVEENELIIPPDSGIYSSKDPLTLARNQYPGMRAKYDSVSGQIKMQKRTPHYLIEYAD